jgi:hypothetical protein
VYGAGDEIQGELHKSFAVEIQIIFGPSGGLTMDECYRPRLSIEISDQQAAELSKMFPHGTKKLVFSILVDDVINMHKKHGERFLAAVIARHIKYEDFISLTLKGGDNSG